MKKATLTLVLALVTASAYAGKKKPFRFFPVEAHVEAAIAMGTRAAGENTALELKDTAQGWGAALAVSQGDTVGTSRGFSLDVYTPFTWIAQNASWKAKKYQQFTTDEIESDMVAPVLRVYAHADSPKYVSAGGMVGTSGVEHVIVRSTKKKGFEVLQPLEIVADEGFYSNAMGGEVSLVSQRAIFDLSEVARVAAQDKKGEFFIVVIGTTGEEKKFKVKTKHFERLP